MRFIAPLIPFTLLMVSLTIASALIFGATFLYSWLWTLVSPFSLWQFAILIAIVFIPMILRFGDAVVNERAEPYLHLLLGPPAAIGIALLFGRLTTAIADVDRWQATLFSAIIVSTLFYSMLRIADKAVERFGFIEEWDLEDDDEDDDYDPDVYDLDDSDVAQVPGLSNKRGRKRK